MNVFEFIEFCHKCPRRKTCHFEGCILDEEMDIDTFLEMLGVDLYEYQKRFLKELPKNKRIILTSTPKLRGSHFQKIWLNEHSKF